MINTSCSKLFLFILVLSIVAYSCNRKDGDQDRQYLNDQCYAQPNERLRTEIEKYIVRNTPGYDCALSVEFINLRPDYSIFTIQCWPESQLEGIGYKSTIKGVNVFLISGIEKYIERRKTNAFASEEIQQKCQNTDFQTIIDSAGLFTSYIDIGIFPNCELPDINELIKKRDQK